MMIHCTDDLIKKTFVLIKVLFDMHALAYYHNLELFFCFSNGIDHVLHLLKNYPTRWCGNCQGFLESS